MLIDAHVHLYPAEVNRDPLAWAEARGERHWKLLCARVRKSGNPVQGFPDVGALLKAMDEAGVERVVLQGWYWEHHDTCVWQNRYFASLIAQHRDRLSACGTFHPKVGEAAVREELRWLKAAGFCGLGELSPHSQLFSIDDPVWRWAMDEAATLGLAVLLHVTEPASRAYPGRVLTPLEDFVRLATEHPATRFVLAHWGARLPLDPALGPAVRKLGNVFYDSAASPLLYEPTVVREMAAAVGPDRLMFGSDYPLILYPREQSSPEIGTFLRACSAQLDATSGEALFCRTAQTAYGLNV